MLCFNTLGDEQIEMKKLKNRLYFISPKHLMGDFVHKALQFDANYTVIWAKTLSKIISKIQLIENKEVTLLV